MSWCGKTICFTPPDRLSSRMCEWLDDFVEVWGAPMGDWPVREDKDSGYDCEVCRSFADNGGGSASELEPFHPDCFIHQYVKRRCMLRLSVYNSPKGIESLAVIPDDGPIMPDDCSVSIKRCELRYGHGGPCQPVGTATDIIPERR